MIPKYLKNKYNFLEKEIEINRKIKKIQVKCLMN